MTKLRHRFVVTSLMHMTKRNTLKLWQVILGLIFDACQTQPSPFLVQLPWRAPKHGQDGAGSSNGCEALRREPDARCVPTLVARSGRKVSCCSTKEATCTHAQLEDLAALMLKPFIPCCQRGPMEYPFENPRQERSNQPR